MFVSNARRQVYCSLTVLAIDGLDQYADFPCSWLCLQVPFWRQRASQHYDGFIVWDYHVLTLELSDNQCLVWDFDT